MKHIVEYRLAHEHVVQVGIEADTPADAETQAEVLFHDGTLWDDTENTPLLYDSFDESDDNVLSFAAVASVETYPDRDFSVQALYVDTRARQAARALVAAYEHGEADGGSIDWSDLDQAYALAQKAVESERNP